MQCFEKAHSSNRSSGFDTASVDHKASVLAIAPIETIKQFKHNSILYIKCQLKRTYSQFVFLFISL